MTAAVTLSTTLNGTCGVGLFAGFYDQGFHSPLTLPENVVGYGGAGWQVAGFIPNKACHEVYDKFKERFQIVMQSPTRHNRNSGNRFFFVVYDTKKPRKSKANPEGKPDLSGNEKYKWPFKQDKLAWNF